MSLSEPASPVSVACAGCGETRCADVSVDVLLESREALAAALGGGAFVFRYFPAHRAVWMCAGCTARCGACGRESWEFGEALETGVAPLWNATRNGEAAIRAAGAAGVHVNRICRPCLEAFKATMAEAGLL